MSNLAEIRGRVRKKLWDVSQAVWSDELLEQAIRTALDAYSQILPQGSSAVVSLAAGGRQLDLFMLDGLLNVARVYWPYDSTEETWPPNRVRGFRLDWIATNPLLTLTAFDGQQPQAGDEVKIWYTCRHTLEDLDEADQTSLPEAHESLLVLGAAGQAVQGRSLDLLNISEMDPDLVNKVERWAEARLQEFQAQLQVLRAEATRGGESWGEGWRLDKWDR
jgi:hypothetical protein